MVKFIRRSSGVNAEDKEGGRWQRWPDSTSNSYNPLFSFPTWFPGVEGIVFSLWGRVEGESMWRNSHLVWHDSMTQHLSNGWTSPWIIKRFLLVDVSTTINQFRKTASQTEVSLEMYWSCQGCWSSSQALFLPTVTLPVPEETHPLCPTSSLD